MRTSRKSMEYKDATKSLWYPVKARHAMHCKRRDAENCVSARAILSIPGVRACKVFQHMTYVWWDDDELPTRYENSPEATYIASLNDKGGRHAIIDEIRDEIKSNGAIMLEIRKPRKNNSKAFLRSAERREIVKKTNERRKEREAAGIPPRAYKKPHTEGLRSGQGRAFIWETQESGATA